MLEDYWEGNVIAPKTHVAHSRCLASHGYYQWVQTWPKIHLRAVQRPAVPRNRSDILGTKNQKPHFVGFEFYQCLYGLLLKPWKAASCICSSTYIYIRNSVSRNELSAGHIPGLLVDILYDRAYAKNYALLIVLRPQVNITINWHSPSTYWCTSTCPT